MNAAVKTLTHRTIALWSVPFQLTREHILIFTLGLSVLLSAFSVVYMKDMNRRLISQDGMLQGTQVQLHNEWSQLLMSKSGLAGQARIASLAKKDYNMRIPMPKSVKMVDL